MTTYSCSTVNTPFHSIIFYVGKRLDNFDVEIEYINIELSIKDKDKETYLRIIRFKKELNSSGGIF